MTYNGVVQALESIIRRYKDAAHHVSCIVNINILKEALDTIKEQKAEIERLNKDCEDVIYKLEYLLCTATGNKFSKHTYPIGDMVSYVNDYIQDCCNEAVEEAKEAVKSEAIKEFEEELEYFILNEDVEIVKPKCKYYGSYINGANQFRHQIKNGIKKLVKEMTE